MSKFTDKLGRLHQSRVRALEENDAGDQKRVFVAEDAKTVDVEPPKPEPPPQVEDTPARAAVREQLQIGARLGTRSSGARRKPRQNDKQKLTMQRADAPAPVAAASPRPRNDNAVGGRLGTLRTQAEALIDAGGIDHALPLLHEMAALSPTHPFPLRHLADYWREKGEPELSAYYAQRLAAAAPY